MLRGHLKGEHRTAEQIREHYEVEKELANRLRQAPQQERRLLYASLYDELFQRVPHHPSLTQKSSPERTSAAVAQQMGFLGRFLREDITFLEVGPGDCALSFAACGRVRQVYAADVSAELTRQSTPPPNFRLILFDGCIIPLPVDSVHVAYSNQVLEHLHPDDAIAQLKSTCAVLLPGGKYICLTPNRLSGPWDISMYFDPLATGFHLKEYTVTELRHALIAAGFARVRAYVGGRGVYLKFPVFPICLLEKFLDALPRSFGKLIGRSLPVRLFLGTRLVATK